MRTMIAEGKGLIADLVRVAAVVGVAASLSACQSPSFSTVGEEAAVPTGRVVSPRLVPGYVLHVTVTVGGEEEVDAQNRRIRDDGTLDLPLLGAVDVEGRTLREFNEYLEKEYNEKYFVDPQVNVSFELEGEADMYPWGYVTVLGKVKEPGRVRVPPTRDLTVTQCIQKTGGLSEYAKENAILITRRNPQTGESEEVSVDLREIADSAGETDIVLKHGDVVYVPEVVF